MGSHVMWAHVKPMIPKSAQEGFLGWSVDPPRASDPASLGWPSWWPGLGVCICDKLPSDVDAAGPRTIFWELLLWRNDKSEMPRWALLHVEHQAPLPGLQFPSDPMGQAVRSWHSGRPSHLYDLPRGPWDLFTC